MTLIALHDRLATGIPAIDENHQLLIGIINSIDDLLLEDPERIVDADILARLMRYADGPLAREEDLLLVTGYPDLVAHQAEHRRAQRFFHECQNDYLDGRVVRCTTVLTFLSCWLSDHVLGRDTACAEYLRLGSRDVTP